MSKLSSPPPLHSRKNPFPAKILVSQKLNLEGSEKETWHYEFSLVGSGLQYEVGDSMGIFPQNNPHLVQELLEALHFSGNEQVKNKEGETFSMREGLMKHFHITQPSKQFLEAIVEKSPGATKLRELLHPDRKNELDRFLWGLEVIDFLLQQPPIRFTPDEFVSKLRKLQPRLYSVASSLKAYPEQVHHIAAIVRYESHGRKREGVATTYLADRVGKNTPIPMFVHVAKGFRLPEDPATPIIMVGPGTGVAPFRAYLQERKAIGAPGKNWLIFGEQRARCDFFYRDEFAAMQNEGVLTRFDTAFSRDQAYKIYVQHRLLENSKEVYAWLQEGAHFFVCGDEARMAKDVDLALHQIVEKEGAMSSEAAAEYVETLRKQKRYKRDVY
ncbi:MAG: sulfite reductase subunit alpha [Verrucomicrobia bacterium]|nr:sulfite reductase subunit alpha [Verrucomicrobiota bacterium]